MYNFVVRSQTPISLPSQNISKPLKKATTTTTVIKHFRLVQVIGSCERIPSISGFFPVQLYFLILHFFFFFFFFFFLYICIYIFVFS